MKWWEPVWVLWALLWVSLCHYTYVGEAATVGNVGAITESLGLPHFESTHRVVLDADAKYILFWSPRDELIEFEVQVATHGYIGLGFSPSGGMKNADIVLAWVKDGQFILHDRHATGYMVPVIDASQDVTLIGGYENDTHTIIRFSRPWNTCDEQDIELGDDTMRVIWAYGYEDPISETVISIHNHRGTKSLYLKDPQFQGPPTSPDVKIWEMRSQNVTLPDNVDTIYWCKLFKIPPIDKKHHIIGYTPIVEAGNEEYVHHFVVYECYLEDSASHYEKWLPVEGSQCFSASMPVSWKYCRKAIVAWAVGGHGEMFPEHAGFPMGEEYGGANYVLFEVHYDNPNLRSGVIDSSGVQMYYTDKLRKHDAGTLIIGLGVTVSQVIPPKQEHWTNLGYCAQYCTKQTIPEEGIHIFQGLLHSHKIGSSISLRHIRNGTELPPILQDKYYDFNFQQTRVFREEKTLLPGDSFFVQCGYDSTTRDVPTFGGLGTREEMCVAYLVYYPQISLGACMSFPQMHSIWNGLRIKRVEVDKNVDPNKIFDRKKVNATQEEDLVQQYLSGKSIKAKDIKMNEIYKKYTAIDPEKFANKTMYDIFFDPETWTQETTLELKKKLEDDKVLMICHTDERHKRKGGEDEGKEGEEKEGKEGEEKEGKEGEEKEGKEGEEKERKEGGEKEGKEGGGEKEGQKEKKFKNYAVEKFPPFTPYESEVAFCKNSEK